MVGERARRIGDTVERVYEQLRSDIVSGRLPAGAPISQLSIAKSTGVSRNPIREALRQLQQDELVVAKANHRFVVAAFDIAEFENVLALTLANLSLAICVAVPLLTAEEICQLEIHERSLSAAVQSRDAEAWERAFRAFALAIAAPAGSRTQSLIARLIEHIERYRSNQLSALPHVWYVDHPGLEDVLAHVRAGDAQKAARAHTSYFGRLALLILTGAAPRHDPVRLRAYMNAMLDGH